MTEPVHLNPVPGKSDAEKAAAYRERLRPLLQQVADVITEARREGLIVNFNIAPDEFGRAQVGNIGVTRPL